MATYVSIRHLNKEDVIYNLWINNLPTLPYNKDQARRMIDRGYIDYLCGVSLKVHFYDDDKIRTDLYNRDTKGKSAERIIQHMNDPESLPTDTFPESFPANMSMDERFRIANELCVNLL